MLDHCVMAYTVQCTQIWLHNHNKFQRCQYIRQVQPSSFLGPRSNSGSMLPDFSSSDGAQLMRSRRTPDNFRRGMSLNYHRPTRFAYTSRTASSSYQSLSTGNNIATWSTRVTYWSLVPRNEDRRPGFQVTGRVNYFEKDSYGDTIGCNTPRFYSNDHDLTVTAVATSP